MYMYTLSILSCSLKSDVLSELPSKIREFVTVPLTPGSLVDIAKLQAEESQLRQQQRVASTPREVEAISNQIRGVQNKAYSVTGTGKLVSVLLLKS